MGETWRPIGGCDGMYDVSNKGNVRSWKSGNLPHRADRPHLLSQTMDRSGRKSVSLWESGKRRPCRVHRLVLLAFVGECPDGQEGCHNDGDASNNNLFNLRWDTHLSNCKDRKLHGKERGLFEKGCQIRAKLTEDDVRAIRKIGRSKTLKEIADLFPIGGTQVSNILLGISWSSI